MAEDNNYSGYFDDNEDEIMEAFAKKRQNASGAMSEEDLDKAYNVSSIEQGGLGELGEDSARKSANKRAASGFLDTNESGVEAANEVDAAGDKAISSGNPYAAAAGVALKAGAMSYNMDAKQKEAEAQAKQARLQNQQIALTKMVDISSRLRRV